MLEFEATEEMSRIYLDTAVEEGDIAKILAALGDIARAKGTAQAAGDTDYQNAPPN